MASVWAVARQGGGVGGWLGKESYAPGSGEQLCFTSHPLILTCWLALATTVWPPEGTWVACKQIDGYCGGMEGAHMLVMFELHAVTMPVGTTTMGRSNTSVCNRG